MPRLVAAAVALFAAVACSTSRAPRSAAPATTRPPSAVAASPVEPSARLPEQLRRDEALARDAAPIVDAFSNSLGPFTRFAGEIASDGRTVLFGSNRDGNYALYLGDVTRPADPPKALTPGPERVTWGGFTRDERAVLFQRDVGADENFHLYRVDLDGAGVLDLTPGDGIRFDEPTLPRGRADVLVTTRRTTASPRSTVVVVPVAGGALREVYEDPAPAFVTDVTNDGARALLVRVVSASELIVLDVDLASGVARRVHPPEGTREAIQDARYSVDGKAAYVATDEGGETSSLFALSLADGKVLARYALDHPGLLIADVRVSPKGDRLAIGIDRGDRTAARILDAATLRPVADVSADEGSVQLGDFSRDGARLVVTIASPEAPPEPFAVDPATGALARLRQDPRPWLDALPPVDVASERITTFDGLSLPMNVYRPRGREGPFPVIVSFHGGPAYVSRLTWTPYNRFFIAQGYAIVEPNVRGSTGFGRAYEMADDREKRAGVLEDMASVNRWVKEQAWADARRVAIYGGSYGGWVVLMGLTQQPDLWSAGVDVFGVADLRTVLRTTDQAIRAIFVDEFGDLEKDEPLLARFSPLPHADRIRAPLFVYAGANDPRVPRAESDAIVAALRRRGVPVEYMVAANEGHSLARRETRIEFLARAARFLGDHMR